MVRAVFEAFDHHNCPGITSDPFAAFDRYRGERIFFTPAYGGYWVLTRFADIRDVLHDTATFSSRHSAIPAISWPRRLNPVELDPPDHGRYRRLLTRYLGQAPINAAIHHKCVELVELLAPRGGCDLVADYAQPIQATLFAALFDLPRDDTSAWAADLSPNVAADRRARALGEIKTFLTERASSPTGLLGALAGLSQEEIVDIGFVMVLASVFTLTNSIGFGFHHLATHPSARLRAIEQPRHAAEELLRLHSVTNVVRTATRDTHLAGTRIATGDRILLSLSLADRDPAAFADPTTLRFDRPPTPGHLAYGAGPHRCLGARIASQALTSALTEWHRRIPTYVLRGDAAITTGGGAVCSLDTLPLTW